MSPAVFREGGFQFYCFSREKPEMHVDVQRQNGEALHLIQEHENDIRSAWRKHFSR